MEFFYFYVAAMSFIALCSYAADKFKAKTGAWRTKEALLLSLGFFGGAPGALLGMLLFNHKTTRVKFWTANLLGALILAAVYWWLYAFGY